MMLAAENIINWLLVWLWNESEPPNKCLMILMGTRNIAIFLTYVFSGVIIYDLKVFKVQILIRFMHTVSTAASGNTTSSIKTVLISTSIRF